MKLKLKTFVAVAALIAVALTVAYAQLSYPSKNAVILLKTDTGASIVHGYNTEDITLSTSSANTDSAGYLLPANSEILGVTGTVLTDITGTCSGWTLQDGTTAGRFAASNTTLTKGTTSIGMDMRNTDKSAAAGPVQGSAAKLRIVCATGAATTGKIRVTVFYRTFRNDTP